jgi:hypothetical protein
VNLHAGGAVNMSRYQPAILGIACGVLLSCTNDVTGPPYEPDLPEQWVATITNRYFPLIPGTTWRYTGQTDEGTEVIIVEVLDQTRMVNGVRATIVHDAVYLDDQLIEDTFDWYAQDVAGNVWYLGEDTKELEDGRVVSTEGSWEWGKNGALPGIYMWGDPSAHMNEEYRQEFYRGEAEDFGKVIGLDQTVDVPFGHFSGCVQTEDWNAIEGRSETLEHKYYCPDIGVALEVPVDAPGEKVQLTTRTTR